MATLALVKPTIALILPSRSYTSLLESLCLAVTLKISKASGTYKRASFHGLMGAELRAMSGIDMALWDLQGKILDRPLYRLLGGCTRNIIPIYFSGIYDEVAMEKQAVQDWSKQCVDEG